MSLGMVGTNYGVGVNYNKYSAAKTKAKSDKTFEMGSATREATSNGDGKNIGVMAIGNQAYLAQYSENSTLAKPIVKNAMVFAVVLLMPMKHGTVNEIGLKLLRMQEKHIHNH